jgi:hypothetical protein
MTRRSGLWIRELGEQSLYALPRDQEPLPEIVVHELVSCLHSLDQRHLGLLNAASS